MKPKVTIVVPVLNGVDYIRQCMDSILSQTLRDIEVIVVDADSTDGTHEILEEYAATDNRVRLYRDIKKSTGYSKNIGIDESEAPYYAIVEPDDYISADMMETLYNKAEETGADIVKGGYDSFVGEGEKTYIFPKSVSPLQADYGHLTNARMNPLIFNWTMFEWTGLYNREFLNRYQIRHNESPGAAFQDTGFWFLTFAFAQKIYLIDKPLYHYRCDNPGASIKNPSKVFNICNEYDYIRSFLEEKNVTANHIWNAFYRGFFFDNMVVIRRIDTDMVHDLAVRICETMNEARESGHINEDLYIGSEKNALHAALDGIDQFEKYLDQMRSIGTESESSLGRIITENDELLIFGAGSFGCNLQYFIERHGKKVSGFIDNDSHKWGNSLNGVYIYSPADAERKYPNGSFLVANKNHASEIRKQLLADRIRNEQINIIDVEQIVGIQI